MKPTTDKQAKITATCARAGSVSLQRGLSLVELMISIAIGLIILAALTTLFINQSKTRSELDKSNRMIDNGRYAMELLSDDLSLAGFYGELNPNGLPLPGGVALPDPCTLVPANMEAALPLAIQGYDAADQSSTAAAPCGLNPKAGSDVLAIRRASTATPIVKGVALAGTHYLQVSGCGFDAVAYRIGDSPASFTLRKSGCTPAASLAWSPATTYTTGATVEHNGVIYVSLANGNLNNTPPTTIGTWWGAGSSYADLRNFMVEVYFVSPDHVAGDGIPTLWRHELDPATHVFKDTPLVEGIEYLQIDYGLDTVVPKDGAPDSFVEAPALAQWSDVVAVKIHILARNTEITRGHKDTKTYDLGLAGNFGPFNDEFKRHAYTRFVTLVNPAGRRQ